MRISMAGAGKALVAGLLPLSVAVAALAAGSAAQAQQRPPAATPAPATPAPAPAAPAATAPVDPDALPVSLVEFDTNKDKIVEQKEFVTVQMKTFDEVDANKDGMVTREEYLKQAEPPFIPADAQNLPPIEERRRVLNLRFTNLDSNQDGKISREEAEQSFVREFIIMDRDQNGRLTAADWRIAQQQAQQAQAGRAPERITKQEFIEGENAVFDRLDTDKDKSLSLAEFLAIANNAPAGSQDQVKARLTTAFAEIDTNKDKKLSLAEWQATSERNFANADRNKDGVLAGEELRPAAPPQAQAAAAAEETREQFVNGRSDELLAKLDTNKDSKISLQEFLVLATEAPPAQANAAKTQLTSSFNAMDGNKNGTVERTELIAHFTAIFNRLDANKDGKITQREVNAATSAPPAQAPRPQTAPAQNRPPATAPAPRPAPQTAPRPPAPAPAPQGGPPPAYPSGQAPITTTPGGQPLR